jgi:hypothetical protein
MKHPVEIQEKYVIFANLFSMQEINITTLLSKN